MQSLGGKADLHGRLNNYHVDKHGQDLAKVPLEEGGVLRGARHEAIH